MCSGQEIQSDVTPDVLVCAETRHPVTVKLKYSSLDSLLLLTTVLGHLGALVRRVGENNLT